MKIPPATKIRAMVPTTPKILITQGKELINNCPILNKIPPSFVMVYFYQSASHFAIDFGASHLILLLFFKINSISVIGILSFFKQ